MEAQAFYTVLAIGISIGVIIGSFIGYFVCLRGSKNPGKPVFFYEDKKDAIHNGRCYTIEGNEFIVLEN